MNEEPENESEEQEPVRRSRKSARDRVMDLIARRDHSVLELRKKLRPYYEPEEIEDAIQFAEENRWLKSPEELAETVARQLGSRNKGARYVRQYLHNKGLPSVPRNAEEELEKALRLIRMKLDRTPPFAFDERAKLARLLSNRGFDDETIRKVLHEKS